MILRWRNGLLSCCVLALALGACRKAAPPPPAALDPNEVIATYAGGQFLRGEVVPDLERRVASDPAGRTPGYRQKALREILERRARIELLYREAVEEGIDQRPDVKALIERDQESRLANDWLQRHAAAGVQAAAARVDEEVARRSMNAPEELRRFSHIFLKAPEADSAARQRARATMDEIRKQLAEGTSFEELARAHSDSITARGGGQVEWTARKPLHPVAAKVVFALSEGQVSDPVETESGLHLFRLDGIRRSSVPDPSRVRDEVKRQLDEEARRAAIEQERARVFDQSGVKLDANALSRPGSPDAVVAVVGKDTIRRREFDVVRDSSPGYKGLPPPELAKLMVAEKILADRRRDEPVAGPIEKSLDRARRGRMVEARRAELIALIPKDTTPQEESDFYLKNRDVLPFLKEYVVDLVFFTQDGPSAAEVYGAGEEVSKRLRAGETFDAILASAARRQGTVVRKGLRGIQLDALAAENDRLAKAMAQLPVREVSRALYLDGKPVTFGQRSPVVSGKGLIFFRTVEVGPFPMAKVRDRIREAIRAEKERAGVIEIQRELNQRTALKILHPEG